MIAQLGRMPLFMAMVLAPALIGGLYLFVIAAPMYVSEARFVVKSPNRTQSVGLTAVFQGVGLNSAEGDAFAAHEFMLSRDGILELIRSRQLLDRLGRPEADIFSRFPRPFEPSNLESLHKAFPRYVTVGYEASTGISTLRVAAFRPDDARDIAEAMLDGSEGLINRLNARAENDAVREARLTVDEAEARVASAQKQLTSFRRRERVVDPAKTSGASLELVGKLTVDLASLRAERSALATSAPQSPQLPGLDNRIAAYEREIEKEKLKVVGEDDSLASKIGDYENLMLEREFADKALASANISLETARQEVRRKRLYLERIVSPNRAEAPTEPKRLVAFGQLLAALLILYGIVVLVNAGFREHGQG